MPSVNIESFLLAGKTIPDVVQNYAQALRESVDLYDILYANKLKEYGGMISDSKFLSNIKEDFDSVYKICQKMGFYFSLDGRRKSLQSFENKVKSLLSKKISLDLLRDIFAFRLVIFDTQENKAQAILNCYKAIEQLILYFSSKGFIPCESIITHEEEPFNPQKYPDIYVPDKPLINEDFQDFVKDYIKFPKANGYQSLHVAFRDSKTGRFFEIQIRTASMHIHAEHSSAKHCDYKEKRYSHVSKEWDLSKININGFYYIPEHKTYMDFVGLIDSLVIFSRRHTF